MKILEINVYNYKSGGSQTVFFNTISGLKEAGHEVVTFSLKWPENLPSEFSDYFPESKDTRTGPLRHVQNIATYFYNTEAAKKIEKLIIEQKPDIAQIHLIWGHFTPSILRVLKKHNIPVVFTLHDYRLVCPAYLFKNGKGEICEACNGKHFYKCVSKTCCKGSKYLSAMMAAEQYFRNAFFHPTKYSSGIIYVSDFSERIHRKHMPELNNVPSLRLYNFNKEIDEQPQKHSNERYFLFFGRLSNEKGITTLIKAFAELPDLKLKIVGTGPLEDEQKKYVNEYGLANIEFLGFKTGDELTRLIRDAYFVIVPSECYENNPMTIIEAYSVATPVIGAEIGGIPEIIIEGKTGFCFKPTDIQSLKSSVIKASGLSEKSYEEICLNALDFAKHNFNKETYINKLVDFYTGLIKKH